MISIKTSEVNKQRVQTFAAKLNLFRNENIIARIAFTYSLSKGRKLNLIDIKDNKGKEYKEDTLFGDRKDFYVALVCQFYSIHKSNPDLYKLIKMHIDDGLELIDKYINSNKNNDLTDFLIQHIELGIEAIEDALSSYNVTPNTNPLLTEKHGFSDLVELEIGSQNNNIIKVPINNTKLYSNSHMTIAGQSGSGKTQFALDILYQISQKTKNTTNFLYLDFKGLNNEDQKNLQNFFTQTNTHFVNVPLTKFPLNPVSFIDNVNEQNKRLGISRLAEIITSYYDAGSSRLLELKEAIRNCFARKKGGNYPNITEIYEEVKANTSGNSKNKIINTLDGLSDPPVFSDNVDGMFLNQNYYFSLSGNMSDDVRFTAIFLVINYIFQQFMSMPDAQIQNGVRSIRYVMLIDEAQILFREKSVSEAIQVILEQIRSKGVVVILVAQNIKEFYTPNFNFSSLCEFSFLLNIKDKSNLKMINSFLGYSDTENRVLARSFENIKEGQAVTNCKELKKGELFDVTQFYKRVKN